MECQLINYALGASTIFMIMITILSLKYALRVKETKDFTETREELADFLTQRRDYRRQHGLWEEVYDHLESSMLEYCAHPEQFPAPIDEALVDLTTNYIISKRND